MERKRRGGGKLDIIGPAHEDAAGVHTIDIWYAAARRLWIVERMSGAGTPIGAPHFSRSKADALACVRHWMHAHAEAHLTPPLVRRRASDRSAAKLLR